MQFFAILLKRVHLFLFRSREFNHVTISPHTADHPFLILPIVQTETAVVFTPLPERVQTLVETIFRQIEFPVREVPVRSPD